MTIYLPKEVWVQIWSFLNFKTLHKICRSVCKTWFLDIRECGTLSGRLKIRNSELQDKELKTILSNWEKLKILELCKETKIDLSATHKFLNKVIIPLDGEDEFQNSFESIAITILEKTVNKIWFDPHNKSFPLSCSDSIIDITLKLYLDHNVYDVSFMKNLESVHIIMVTEENERNEAVCEPLFQSLSSCPNLENFILEVTYTPNFSILGTLIVAYLPDLKSLDICDAFHGFNGSTGSVTEVFFGHLNWLPRMGKLETLSFSDSKLVFDATTDLQIFYENPMKKLKRLELSDIKMLGVEIGTYPFVITSDKEASTFFINLKNLFPALETLVLGSFEEENYIKTTLGNLSSILNSLGNVKNLIISEMTASIIGRFDGNRIRIKNVFEEALDIINKKFPIDTTEIEISENVCNFNILKEKGKSAILRRKLEENPLGYRPWGCPISQPGWQNPTK